MEKVIDTIKSFLRIMIGNIILMMKIKFSALVLIWGIFWEM